MIPIEDDPCDVIAKAMRGLGVSQEILSQQSQLSHQQITAALDGDTTPEVLEKIAPCLHLSAQALIGLPSYRPNIVSPVGLETITSPFGHAGVNSYIITCGDDALVIDTGTDATPIFDFLSEKKLRVAAVIITHGHHDHTSGVHLFQDVPVLFPEDLDHGQRYEFSDISFTSLDVSGHASPARAYFYEELSSPVCIVGDSLFAGSIGGTTDPQKYQLALKTLRENILTLPENTVLATGHGPLTTLAMEMTNNPFLAQ